MTDLPQVLLSDANVLIDYRDSDPTVLRLVSEHVGPVHVLRQVLDEIRLMTLSQCHELSITVHELETEVLLEQVKLSSRLAYSDRLCFLACQMNGWTCVTNDRRLRRTCEEHDISLFWGLEPMIELVRVSALTPKRARRVAATIHENNPFHISRGHHRAIRSQARGALKRTSVRPAVPVRDRPSRRRAASLSDLACAAR